MELDTNGMVTLEVDSSVCLPHTEMGVRFNYSRTTRAPLAKALVLIAKYSPPMYRLVEVGPVVTPPPAALPTPVVEEQAPVDRPREADPAPKVTDMVIPAVFAPDVTPEATVERKGKKTKGR